MQKVYYKEYQLLQHLLDIVIKALEKYNNKEYDCDNFLLTALTESHTAYGQAGLKQKESKILALKSEFITAQRGINPLTFEKVAIRRGEMQSTISFKVLHDLEEIVRTDLIETEVKIKQAEDLVNQIILAAYQGGILTAERLKKIRSNSSMKNMWKELGRDPNINMGQKRVLLIVSEYDAYIILDDTLTRLREAVV